MISQRQDATEREKRLMAMGQMAASLAHEIRNPLGSMELYCSLLKKDLKELPDCLELASHIHSGIRTLDRIITNCLQFSRDILPRLTRLEQTEPLLAEIFSYVEPKARELGVSLVFGEQGVGEIWVDSHLVKQALLNVVVNAVEAAGEESSAVSGNGQPVRKVSVESDRSSCDYWRVRVFDTGPGIREEDRERIFDPFFTSKAQGTGLGLAIVYTIVRAHRGNIVIDSEEGTGTSVCMEFPNPPR